MIGAMGFLSRRRAEPRPRWLTRALIGSLPIPLALACSPGSEQPSPRFERVILLTCDTLRADRLGCYGYERSTTPNLDALARGGLTFEHAFASAPMTTPAVSSVMTGRLPREIGAVPGNRRVLPPEAVTLAEVIAAAGIPTLAVVSNWILHERADEAGARVGVAQGFDVFDDEMERQERNRGEFERTARPTTQAAISRLEELLVQGDERFFLWVHYQDPHGPYEPPPGALRELFAGGALPRSAERLALGTSSKGAGQIPAYQALAEERDPEVYRALYDAEIRHFDAELGRLLGFLRARGLLDDALVLFTSDHGESMGEHDHWFCHGENVFREQVSVPLILSAPGSAAVHWKPGERSSALAGQVDVFPTVLAALGLEGPDVRGVSLLAGAPAERILPQDLFSPKGLVPAVSDGRHRAVWSAASETWALYDLEADPLETRDLSSEDPARLAALVEAHAELHLELNRAALEGSDLSVDVEGEGRLRALGYSGDEDD